MHSRDKNLKNMLRANRRCSYCQAAPLGNSGGTVGDVDVPVSHSTHKEYMEEAMSVKILITRTVKQENARDMLSLFKQMRSLATEQDGYISGETLKSSDRPDVYLVISTWASANDWENWLKSKKRQEIQNKIDALLGGKTAYEMFHYGLRE